MDEDSIQQLYAWIDEITLSRPKRNIARDFSDGVLAAEIVAHFIPSIVEIHNYTPANSSQQKRTNWDTLNRKVFRKIEFNVPGNIVNGIIACKPGVIEIVLYNLRVKVLNYKSKTQEDSESDYNGGNAEPWNTAPSYYNNIVGPPSYHQQPYTDSTVPPFRSNYKQPTGVITFNSPIITRTYSVHSGASAKSTVHLPSLKPLTAKAHTKQTRYSMSHGKDTLPHTNGGMEAIPFDGERPKKKKSPKKKKKNLVPHTESQRSRSMPSNFAHLDHESRIFIQEREQALMQTQETVQILQSKISRLEHLLQLKDLRIEDLDMKLKASLAGQRPGAIR